MIGVDSRDPRVELERTEYVRVGNQHALIRRIVMAAEIDTVDRHPADRGLDVASPRDAHENNVIGTMNILAACRGAGLAGPQARLQVLGALLRLRARRPGLLHRGHAPPAPAAHADRARHRRGRGGGRRVRREATRDVTVTVLRFANVARARARHAHTACCRLPVVPMILGFDPRYQFIHEDDIVGCARVRRRARTCPGVYNAAADGVLALSEVAACWASRARRCCRRWAPGWWPRRCAALGRAHPAGDAQPAALRTRARQPPAEGGGLSSTATPRARRS